MPIIYWAHSYRQEDAPLNKHFGFLIEQGARIIINFDPPSDKVNASKLEQNLRCCDGMVAILTWRQSGPSPYILYEIGLALRARKPLLVFVDDRLPSELIPNRVLQRRFSHRTYFRQVREHSHALRDLVTYMGDPPVPRYQPSSSQRTCGLIGLRGLDAHLQSGLTSCVEGRGYRAIDLESLVAQHPLEFEAFERLIDLSVALECVDKRTSESGFWTGVIAAAAIPSITYSLDFTRTFLEGVPTEFQPRLSPQDSGALGEIVCSELELFEQDFLKVHEASAIERYTRMQVEAGDFRGRYESNTRSDYVEVIMGDKYNVSGQAGAVGPQAHAHDMTFNQVWQQLEPTVDLQRLAEELKRLREVMETESIDPGHRLATGAVAAAEQSARQGDGPKSMEYLKLAGKWAFTTAEKIGVGLATAALKGALGLG